MFVGGQNNPFAKYQGFGGLSLGRNLSNQNQYSTNQQEYNEYGQPVGNIPGDDSANAGFGFENIFGKNAAKAFDFGKQFGSLGDLTKKLGGLQNIKGLGDVASLAGNLGKGLASAVSGGFGAMKAAAAANPVGAILAVGSKVFDIGSKTKAAKAQEKVYDKQIDSTFDAVADAKDVSESEKEITELNRDIGIETGGKKISSKATALEQTAETAYAKSGGLQTSGEIEFQKAGSEESLEELAVSMEEDQTRKYDEGVAEADARYDQFADQAYKQIRELEKKKSSLKTKWYQNV